MLRTSAGCRGFWQRSETFEGIKEIARSYSQGRNGIQEIQCDVGGSLLALLSPACEAPQSEGGPLRLSDALPTVINGAMTEENGWGAIRWSKGVLIAASNGETMVPVEVSINGGDYRDLYRAAEGSNQRQFEAGVPVPLSFLMDHIQQLSNGLEEMLQADRLDLQSNSDHVIFDGSSISDLSDSTGEESLGMSRQATGSQCMRLYLAQRDVSEVLPELAAAVPASPPFQEVRERLHQRSVWLGPKGTQTPLHRDPYHNLLCQVWGTKLVRLYSPQHTSELHPFPDPFLRNTSQVDVLDPQAKRYLGFEAVPYLECWLRQGQMLFIPRKWWHFVQSASSSLSISYWWTNDQG